MTLKTHIIVYFSSLLIGLTYCDNNYIIEIMVYFFCLFFSLKVWIEIYFRRSSCVLTILRQRPSAVSLFTKKI